MDRKLVQKIALIAGGSTLAALVVFQFGNYLFRGNLHTVIPGQIYRSAQPTPVSLARWIESIGLRSLINLKGKSRTETASGA